MHIRSLIALAAAPLFLLSACTRNMDGNTVSSSSSVGKVLYGTVVSARTVTIKDNERLQDNVVGGAAGGVVGGVAGSGVGKGTGQDLAVVGGAIAGAVLGAVIQDELSTSQGQEYIVRLDGAQQTANTTTYKKDIKLTGRNGVENDVMDSVQMAPTQAEMISVIQQDDVPIQTGTRVMVVYRDDRARIVPAQ